MWAGTESEQTKSEPEFRMATYGKGTVTVSSKDIEPTWYIVDAEDQVLGRLASRVAKVLRGKHRPTYSPHVDLGDRVIVVNAAKIRLTGNKRQDMKYFSYSGYPGGAKFKSVDTLMKTDPAQVMTHAVRGMLPKGTLGYQLLSKLRVYADDKHPHAGQNPQPLP